MIRRWLYLAGAAVAVLAFVGIYRAGDEKAPPPASAPVLLQQGLVEGHRLESRSWSFRYDRVQTSADGSIADVDGVHDGTLFKNGKPFLRMTATHLTINTSSNDYTAIGPLHFESVGSGEKRTFDTDAAFWTNATQRLVLPHRIRFGSGDAVLRVETITIDVKSGDIRLGKIDGAIHV